MDGVFKRLNGEMVTGGNFEGQIFSVVGEMISCDGAQLNVKTSDGSTLTYSVTPDFVFEQGRTVELMGTMDAEIGMLTMFVARDLGADFDLGLYNDFLTKVLPKHAKYFS